MLSERNKKILKILFHSEVPVTAKQLANQLHLSVRTIQYSLRELEDWANANHVELDIRQRTGTQLKNKEQVKPYLENDLEPLKEDIFYSSDARLNYEILFILNSDKPMKIQDFIDLCQVSKTTIVTDIHKMEEYFRIREMPFIRDRRGMFVDGTEKQIRKEILHLIFEHCSVKELTEYIFSTDIASKLNEKKEQYPIWYYLNTFPIQELKEYVYGIQEKKNVLFSDSAFLKLVLWIGVTILRLKQGNHLILDSEERNRKITYVEEYLNLQTGIEIIEEKEGIRFTKDEFFYMASIIATNQKIKGANTFSNEYVDDFIQMLENSCEKIYGTNFQVSPDILQNLRLHLASAMLRVQYGISNENPLLKSIQTQYQQSYIFCYNVAKKFERKYQIVFSDDEIGYIAVYMELALSSLYPKTTTRIKKAVVICNMGYATSKILSKKIEQQFPNILIIDQLSVAMASIYDFSSIDMVFATVNISVLVPKPVIVVNPLMTYEDIRHINEFLTSNENQDIKVMKYTQIMKMLSDKSQELVDDSLERRLKEIMGIDVKEVKVEGLFDLMKKNFCQAKIQADTWEEAVWKAAAPLLEDGKIKKCYVEEIIHVKNKYNNYYMVGNSISMPHADPKAGVMQRAISFISLEQPLKLVCNNKPAVVYFIMILAVTDNKQHANALEEVLNIMDREDVVERLTAPKTSEDLYRTMKELSRRS